MLRTVEVKLYPTPIQTETLTRWLRECCRLYNRCLEMRKKAYERRGKTLNFYDQTAMITQWRRAMPSLREVPFDFAKDAPRRLDKAFKAFFHRVKNGEKPGYPRFKSSRRYDSIEFQASGKHIRGDRVVVAKLGAIKCRGEQQDVEGKQRVLRIVRRSTGWFAQVVIDDGKKEPEKRVVATMVGVDVGLNTFAALSTGEKVGNPRWARTSAAKLARAQRKLSRCVRGSRNRRKAVARVRRIHERVAAQRKDFYHQLSHRLVNEFDLIAFENLNIKGMARTRLARSIMDAGWGILQHQLTYKAENAGRHAVAVNPSGTSQICPECGVIKKKSLKERIHACSCGCVLDRDVASAKVILARAAEGIRRVTPAERSTTTNGSRRLHVVSKMQVDQVHGLVPSN